jgi:putative transposase
MARLARVVAAGVAHHVTQRGNARQFLLATDSERMIYLDLLRQAVRENMGTRVPVPIAQEGKKLA